MKEPEAETAVAVFKLKSGVIDHDHPDCIDLELADHITPEAEYVFSQGQCHALALAIHALTKWEIYGVYYRDEGERTWYAAHFLVQHPSKSLGSGTAHNLFDVQGMNPSDFFGGRFIRLKPETVLRKTFRDDIGMLPISLHAAKHFAPMVIARAEKQADQHVVLRKCRWWDKRLNARDGPLTAEELRAQKLLTLKENPQQRGGGNSGDGFLFDANNAAGK